MPDIELLDPEHYRHIPWKNGKGVLVQIAGEGGESWSGNAMGWHYGRTSITMPGPFSDLSGYERLQTVIKGQGLVLETPGGDIDLRHPFRPQRYDGGTPIVTRLENGSVEVANLIARKEKFRIDLRVVSAGEQILCGPGEHIFHAATEDACVQVRGSECSIPDDHALRIRASVETLVSIVKGRALIASVSPIGG